MAAKRGTGASPLARTVTADRARRLYRLLQLLGTGPQSRDTLLRKLRLDIRGFYRDLELLRTAGIGVLLSGGRYRLADELDEAVAQLPFPDPGLTLGEAIELARGRTAAHRKIKAEINRIVRR
jgi:hypothetical protein